MLGDVPAGLRGDPRQRQAEQREPEQPWLALGIALDRSPAGQANSTSIRKTGGDHHAEGPEQAEHIRDGVQRGSVDLLVTGVHHIGGVLLQQQAVAQVLLDLVEGGNRRGRLVATAQDLQALVGEHAVADAQLVFGDQVLDALTSSSTERVAISPST